MYFIVVILIRFLLFGLLWMGLFQPNKNQIANQIFRDLIPWILSIFQYIIKYLTFNSHLLRRDRSISWSYKLGWIQNNWRWWTPSFSIGCCPTVMLFGPMEFASTSFRYLKIIHIKWLFIHDDSIRNLWKSIFYSKWLKNRN